ncbi:hypothetical protein CCACVL1_09999 [Corchorus capsularis]|uniref:Uncharacterized protein n=1 Tax=Corchorus capsularis TaxID=210143 RepID=A0A1R3IT79_COCAP|nr:hypothetical protein CCACVL1_09999 [Corchorus capsularis]
MGRASGSSRPRKNKRNSKKHKRPVVIKEHQESPSENNPPNTAKAPQTQPIAEAGMNHGAPPARDDQVQQVDNQMKVNSNNFGRHNNPAYVGHENPNPNFHQGELVSSPAGSTNETTNNALDHQNGAGGNSNPQIRQPAFQGNIVEGTDSSHGDGEEEAVAAPPPPPPPPPAPAPPRAQQTGMSTPFSPLIMEQLHQFPMALAEKIPENANCGGGAQSCHSENEVTSKAANENVGSSSQAEHLGSRIQTLDRGKAIMTDDQFEFQQNNIRNNNFNDNQEALPPYPSNLLPQTPSEMGFFNGGSSSQFNQQLPNWTSSTGNDLYRPMPPSGSEINPFNATNSSSPMCFNFILPQPAPLRPHHFSQQPDQAQMAPGAYNPQNFSSVLPESSVPLSLRTPILPAADHINPLDTSNLHYRYNSLQPKSNMLPSSQPLPAYQQASNQFSMLPPLPNSDTNYQNSVLPSLLPRLPTVEQPTLNQTTSRPTPIYPRSGNYLPTLVFNSLLQAQEIGGRRGRTRRFEVGESSSFKRFRRDPNAANSSQQVTDTSLSLKNNEATAAEHDIANLQLGPPRGIKNSLYDPIFEGLGLPVDPHLRMFLRNN